MNGFSIGRSKKGRYTRQMGLGNTQKIWVSQKLTGPTVGAATAFEVVSIYKLTGATGRTGAGGLFSGSQPETHGHRPGKGGERVPIQRARPW
jgi:hypothetical protein